MCPYSYTSVPHLSLSLSLSLSHTHTHTHTHTQDAWVWRAPLPSSLAEIDFKLGKPGCDDRFAYELRRAGLRVMSVYFCVFDV